MHRRASVRAAIVAALDAIVDGPPVTAGRVYPDSVSNLPGLNVLTGAEEVEEELQIMQSETGIKWLQSRSCVYSVECRATAGSVVDDALDALALAVEQALGVDLTLGGEVTKIEYIGSDESELSGEIESPIGLRTLTYQAIYRVDARDPQALEA